MNIFGITFYRLTSKQIAEWNMNNSLPNRLKMDLFPNVIVKNEGKYKIQESDFYFQFYTNPDILENPDEKYILFEISTTDNILNEEINQEGEFEFLETIKLIDIWENIKDKILIHDYDSKIVIAQDQFFAVEITTNYDSFTNDYDYDIEYAGYFDRSFVLQL